MSTNCSILNKTRVESDVSPSNFPTILEIQINPNHLNDFEKLRWKDWISFFQKSLQSHITQSNPTRGNDQQSGTDEAIRPPNIIPIQMDVERVTIAQRRTSQWKNYITLMILGATFSGLGGLGIHENISLSPDNPKRIVSAAVFSTGALTLLGTNGVLLPYNIRHQNQYHVSMEIVFTLRLPHHKELKERRILHTVRSKTNIQTEMSNDVSIRIDPTVSPLPFLTTKAILQCSDIIWESVYPNEK